MNFIENESAQKLRGGFYTEPNIASFLTRWVLEKMPKSLLEPSCGDGAFLEAITAEKCDSLRQLFACEMDQDEAARARARVPSTSKLSVEIHSGDFLRWFLFHSHATGHFDGILGNPPFIRYQYLPAEQQFLAEKVFSRFGLPFTKHTNAWVSFVIASFSLLSPGGRLAMVIPSEIFHISHAQSLRRFLAAHCSRILIFDPEELWFENALQGVVLLLAEKKINHAERSLGIAVHPVDSKDILHESPSAYFVAGDYINGESIEGKWMPVFLSKRERSLLKALRADTRFATFDQLAKVDVGIVTGANKFFLVTDEIVESFGLQQWAHPMFGRSEHVAGVIFDKFDLAANKKSGLPTNFLWFDDVALSSFPASVQRYLRSGEEQELPKRYKCRVREPWFRVPSVYASPVAMLKRAHHYPRLILNKAKTFTTDTAYRIQLKEVTAVSLVYSFLNSLTCLCAELEGRHYGGGVLELVPSEIERLILPICSVPESELRGLDERFRVCSDDSQILREQDVVVLRGSGLSTNDLTAIHDAWDRLRNRRQRNPVSEEDQVMSMKNGAPASCVS
ncbi:MAG TPA: N-6 DNA methylase [Verrucomicrobiae bacterium]|jgi:adenine-specific DNA methylase|nr:N-6 DNA methylase [Verrucomicrobiae bacterium]